MREQNGTAGEPEGAKKTDQGRSGQPTLHRATCATICRCILKLSLSTILTVFTPAELIFSPKDSLITCKYCKLKEYLRENVPRRIHAAAVKER